MGATSFHVTGTGPSARAAFAELATAAAAEHEAHADTDHDCFCSNIGDKTAFTTFPLPPSVDPHDVRAVEEAADVHLMACGDDGLEKWGPAGCFDLGPNPDHPHLHLYAFFGWAPE